MANPSGEEYGGFLARFFAFICDQLIAAALLYLIIALLAKVGVFSLGLYWLLLFVVPAVYFAAMQSSAGQATIGKGLLGLKVATVGGDRASFLRNLGREFAKIISAIPLMIGYLMAIFTGRKQALHDMVASTVVLDVGPAKVVKGAVVVVLAFVANGAIFAFMMQDVMNKMQAELMGAMMAEMQGAQGGLPPGMTGMPQQPRSAPTVTPVAPKVVVTPAPTPAPQTMAVAPAAPKAASNPAPQATSAPAPQSAPVMVARAEPAQPMPAMAPRAVAQAPAPKPAAAEPPAAETPPALPADMPARVNSAPAAASAPTAASASSSTKDVPPPAVRPGVPGPKYNDLMTAVLNRDASGVNELLAFGKWVDKPDSRGVTPLMIAVRNGDAEITEALLKAGADPSRNAVGGESPAKIAAARRDAAMTALLERYTTKR